MATKKVPSQISKNGAKIGWVLSGIPPTAEPVVFGDKLYFWDKVSGELLEAEACRTEFIEQDNP